jgi:hypothetical protein
MAHANKPVKGTTAAVEQQVLLSGQSGKEVPVAQDQGKPPARENDDSVLAGNAAVTDEVSASQTSYASEGDAGSAEQVAPIASTDDVSVSTWRYIPAAASASSSDLPVQPHTADMADSIKIETRPFNGMDGLTVASNAFALQHSASVSAPAQATALESVPAPAPAALALAVPAPDLAAVSIPAPPFADDGAMFRNSNKPALYLGLTKTLQTGYYVEIQITDSSGKTLAYNSKDNPADFVFMGQNVTTSPPGGLADGTYGLMAIIYDSGGNVINRTPPGGRLVVDTVAPTETPALTAISSDTGIAPHDFITNDKNQTFSGTLSSALATGTQSGVSHEVLMIDLINQSSGKSVLGGPQAAIDNGLTWSFTPGFELYDGTYTVQLQIKDAAGNITTLPADRQTVLIDTIAPNDAQLLQTGGNYLTITSADRDATVSGLSTTGTHLIFSGSYDGALADGTQSGISAERVEVNIDGTGWRDAAVNTTAKTWTLDYSGTALSIGTHQVQVRLADAAGNSAPDVSSTITVREGGGGEEGVVPPPVEQYSTGQANAGMGYSMSAIGDFNGDGYTDYIVSAPGSHLPNQGAAAAYILFGGPNGLPHVSNLDNLTAEQGIKITNSNTSGHHQGAVSVPGGTVVDIGDFNGDGLSDVAIVSPLFDSATGLGAVYVIYGQRTPQNIDLNKPLDPSIGFKVISTTGFAGYSVTGADLNGDGYSDLVFGDPTAGPKSGGAAYVIYGHSGTQGTISIVPNSGISGNSTTVSGAGAAGSGYTVLANNSTNGLGTVLSAVGDVNGDGYADYVATTPGGLNSYGYTTPGSAYLIFGGPNGVTQGSTVSSTTLDSMAATGQGIKITASNSNEFLGGRATGNTTDMLANALYPQFHSVNGLGNIDGSGRNAFAIGSPTAIKPYVNTAPVDGAGAVYVLYGDQANWSNIALPSYNNGTWTGGNLNGTNGFVVYSSSFADKANGTKGSASDLGFAVSSAGDVNGDGIDDFLIGAPMANNGKGAVFLVFGEAGGLPWAHDSAGNPIVGVVNLDQLVSAGKASTFGTAGTAVQYDGTLSDVGFTGSGSYLGTDVTGGDFNGTGIHGYSFGAWGDNVGNAKSGQVYVYDGTTVLLTQAVSNDSGQIYYAGDNPASVTTMMKDGVDLIATGSGNNDWVHGIGTDTTGKPAGDWSVQHDAVNGGIGNDYIGIVGTDFTSINGGGGWNSLVFEQSGLTLDLTQMGLRVQNIGQFDLSNSLHTSAADPRNLFSDPTTGNTLKLSLADVLSENGAAGPSSQHMTILGDSSSTVVLDNTSSLAGSGWMMTGSQAVDGTNFDVYHNMSMGSNTAADLLIQHGVQVI